ncbi:DUF3140 domain-containing protein [Streptomyces sp. NPDC056437]|uniref:DUF3140 domain-containing protein n=1 Tax=Streptomyces sp. NPDC056437 TaxID=3345816 RepID=UPI0036C203D3
MGELNPLESQALWEEFHQLVNMTSQELTAWLRTSEAAETLPESAGAATGLQVVALLHKRRADLTDEDVQLMLRVVEEIEDQQERASDSDDERWRQGLMTLGHDPLKP